MQPSDESEYVYFGETETHDFPVVTWSWGDPEDVEVVWHKATIVSSGIVRFDV